MAVQNLIRTTEESVLVNFAPVSAKGKPSVLDGDIKETVLSGNGTVEKIDGLHFKINTTDTVDGIDTRFKFVGDPNLGPEDEELVEEIILTTVAAPAVSLGITTETVAKP